MGASPKESGIASESNDALLDVRVCAAIHLSSRSIKFFLFSEKYFYICNVMF